MPTRNLSDGIRRSPNLRDLSDAAERLWWRIVSVADDFGRFEADPEVLLSACFQRMPKGWNKAKVAKHLPELFQKPQDTDAPLLYLYTVQGRQYLQIVKTEPHFRKRAKFSKFPDPPEGADATCQTDAGQVPDARARSPISEIRDPNNESTVPHAAASTADRFVKLKGLKGLEDFTVDRWIADWAKEEGIPHPDWYLKEFKDWWGAREGKAAKISDWHATYRNRLRTLRDMGRLYSKPPIPQTPTPIVRLPMKAEPVSEEEIRSIFRETKDRMAKQAGEAPPPEVA